MLDWLYELLGTMLSWFSSLMFEKYVFGLILYALLFKLLFLPFSIKQQKNQIKMALLAPKIELIKAKYKGRTDAPTMQKQQQEIMELQQKEGYSPFSGCLPLLLQMPIIVFLYNVIRGPLSYICKFSAEEIETIKGIIGSSQVSEISLVGEINAYRANGGGGLAAFEASLDKLPDFKLFGTNLAENPSFTSWTILIPVIAAVLTWLSMFLSRKWNSNPATQAQDAQANASMKMMDLMMPAMTLFMAYSLQSLMGIYWIYQSALGILQSFIISHAMPLPKFSEEELREMKKAQKAAEKAAISAAKNAPKHRSLHYIDEDDYDALPEVKSDKKDTGNTGSMDLPEI
ncbi:MAG: YidC/Oxa1 family membrane protein insertase [Clostridia bacterium]|nr:YidC/Oxa1 family membrane protein insertase [Clostridia bacterium]